MSLWSGCLRNCLVFEKRSLYGQPSGLEADTMADGRRLAFEDSRKLGVTCKTNSLRFWLGNFNDGFHQFGDP